MNKSIGIIISVLFIFSACQQSKIDPALLGNWKTDKKWDYQNQEWIEFDAGTYIFHEDGTFGMLSADGKDITTIVSGQKEGKLSFVIDENGEQRRLKIQYPESDKVFLSANISLNSSDSLVIETIETSAANKEMILFLKK